MRIRGQQETVSGWRFQGNVRTPGHQIVAVLHLKRRLRCMAPQALSAREMWPEVQGTCENRKPSNCSGIALETPREVHGTSGVALTPFHHRGLAIREPSGIDGSTEHGRWRTLPT
jgi:hypothetical protein